jgi:hypothetical protein
MNLEFTFGFSIRTTIGPQQAVNAAQLIHLTSRSVSTYRRLARSKGDTPMKSIDWRFDDYHVQPMFVSHALFYRGRPLIILSAQSGKMGAGLVKVETSTMHRIAKDLGLFTLDRYLKPLHRAPELFVLCRSNSVTIERNGSVLSVARHFTPDIAWLDEAERTSEVLIVVCVPNNPGAVDIAKLISAGRAFGAVASCVRVHDLVGDGRYQFLGGTTSVEPVSGQHSILCDSNLLINLDSVARGTGDPTSKLAATVQQVVLRMIHSDVLPALGLLELTIDRATGQFDRGRAQELAAAKEAWFEGGARRAASIPEVRNAYETHLQNPALIGIDFGEVIYPHQPVFFACLVKLAALWVQARGQFRALQRVDLYKQFTEWMSNELGLVLAFPLVIAHDRLVGPQGQSVAYVDKLLKLGKNPLQDLWGAAWDLSHIASVDLAEEGSTVVDFEGRDGCLVTADQALPKLRERIRHATTLMDDDRVALVGKLVWRQLDPRLRDHVQTVLSATESLESTATIRPAQFRWPPSPDHLSQVTQTCLDEFATVWP